MARWTPRSNHEHHHRDDRSRPPLPREEATAGCRDRPLLPRGHPLRRRRPHHRGRRRHARDDVQAVRRQGGARPRLPAAARTSSCGRSSPRRRSVVGRSRRPARPRDRAASRPTSATGTRAAAPSSTPPPSTPTTGRCASSSPITASGSAARSSSWRPRPGLSEPAEVAASLVLLRDAALVGGYLDGQDRVAPAFARTARGVIAAHRPLSRRAHRTRATAVT